MIVVGGWAGGPAATERAHTGTSGDASDRARYVFAEVETFTGGSTHEPRHGQRRLEDPRELYRPGTEPTPATSHPRRTTGDTSSESALSAFDMPVLPRGVGVRGEMMAVTTFFATSMHKTLPMASGPTDTTGGGCRMEVRHDRRAMGVIHQWTATRPFGPSAMWKEARS